MGEEKEGEINFRFGFVKKIKVLEMNLFQIISGNEEAKGCVDEVWGNCDACVC